MENQNGNLPNFNRNLFLIFFFCNFLADIIINFIFAGRETWFFWLLHKNPRIKTEILKNIKQKPNEVKDMVYTHAFLCESMRLFPQVAMEEKFAADDDILPVVGGVMGGVPTGEVVGEGCVGEVVFQAGLRVCLGREMTFLQMKRVAAGVLRQFWVVPVRDDGVDEVGV